MIKPKVFEDGRGFLVLSDAAEVIYKADNVYAPDYERGLIWNDPDVHIIWPNDKPILSPKDRELPTLRELIEKDKPRDFTRQNPKA